MIKGDEKSRKPLRPIGEAAQQTADAILDAAEGRIRRHGMAGLKLMAIAEAAGITHPLILHHFGSKNGLVDAIATRHAARIRDMLLGLIQEDPDGPPQIGLMMQRMQSILEDDGIIELAFWGLRERPEIMQPVLNEIMNAVMTAAIARRRRRLPDADLAEITAEIQGTLLTISMMLWGQALVGRYVNPAISLSPDDRSTGRNYVTLLLLNRLMGS